MEVLRALGQTSWIPKRAKRGGAMRILGVLAVAILICTVQCANAAAIADADNLGQAASMVLAEAKIIDAAMDECARANPSQLFAYRFADLLWQGENKDMVLAAQKVSHEIVTFSMPMTFFQKKTTSRIKRHGLTRFLFQLIHRARRWRWNKIGQMQL
jgi:hypothetical protein